ncbi:MAG: YfiR family protein [Sphingomonas sp.]|nr:YfiR family protein [Sphingomonas sp.]
MIFISTIAAALLAPVVARAQVSDTAVKAAFIPKFARYVTWPSNARAIANGPMAICVIGDNPFGDLLNRAAADEQVDGRNFVVRRLASAVGASNCAIAVVDGDHTGETLAALGRQPILTVTDSRSSSQRGIIHFAVVDGRVRFFIDNVQAQARGLTISSRLLALAIGVNQK